VDAKVPASQRLGPAAALFGCLAVQLRERSSARA
jgi:hypothetical protein